MSITSPSVRGLPLYRRTALVLLIAVATMFTWAAAATASNLADAGSHGRLATLLIQPTTQQIEAVITPASPGDPLSELQHRLMSEYPQNFGGIFVNSRGEFAVATDGTVPAALRQAATAGFVDAGRSLRGISAPDSSASRVTFVDTGASLRHLYELKAAVLDNPRLRAAGVDGAGLDVEHGRDVVMSSTSAGAAAVKAAYGSTVEVMVDSGSGLTASRYGDVPAWNAGDQIVTPSYGETTCTSGFGMEDTSTGETYLLTAGHCGAATWYNTKGSDPVYDSSTLVGATVAGSVSTSVIDAQLIQADSSCISWGGKSTKTSNDVRIYITGYIDPPQGASIETEGSVSTEQRGTVSYYDVSRVVGGESLQDLDLISSVGTGGDSGGPLVYPTAFGPLAGGTEVGWYSSGDSEWGVFQLIDSEVYTYTAFTGDQIQPISTTQSDSC
jgi:hypothetical protein